jgi:hypothetical protein
MCPFKRRSAWGKPESFPFGQSTVGAMRAVCPEAADTPVREADRKLMQEANFVDASTAKAAR